MTRALDVIGDYLDWRGFPHLRMDGGTPAAERGDLVTRFNDPGGPGAKCARCRVNRAGADRHLQSPSETGQGVNTAA